MSQCTNCGSTLSVNDRFCPSCGQEVLDNAQPTNNEEIKGIITDVKKKESMLKYQSIFLIPTSKRLIFFMTTRAIEKQAMDTFAKSLEGQGFKERLKANLSSSNRMMAFFENKSAEEILAMSPESYSVNYDDIVRIKFPSIVALGSKKNLYKLKIETKSDTHEVYFDPQRNEISNAKEIFKSVIPEKVA